MDDSSIQVSTEDIARLSPADQRGLQEFLQTQQQQSTVQSTVHLLTETCFKKCIPSVSGGKLASKEESCMRNCVERFMDSNLAVLKHLETLRASQ